MASVGLYAALATTAGVFVGLLNAYLVSRITGLKGDRRRITQRIKSIDARLISLNAHREWREQQISEQQERRVQEQAQDDVDQFIDFHVGRDWSPSPEDISFQDLLEALAEYHGREVSDLNTYHVEELRDRWEDIIEELQPRTGMFGADLADIPPSDSHQAARHQIETQWEVYDRTVLERRNADYAQVNTEIESLRKERDRLEQQYVESDPGELIEGLKSTWWAIVLSVVVPLLAYLLHAIGIALGIPAGAVIEPILIFGVWFVGLYITYRHIRDEVTTEEDGLPDSPLENQDEKEESSNESDNEETNGDRVQTSDEGTSPAETEEET